MNIGELVLSLILSFGVVALLALIVTLGSIFILMFVIVKVFIWIKRKIYK